ncbi:MAG TPA: hypothetical protein DCY20_07575 [Firmicutes bacterium]|nr:hypothetical protein [Bacillota bacterium]
MELINRYVYAVVRQLPEHERAEIEKELHGLIDEMMTEYAELSGEEAAKHVIEQLGDPQVLANKYRGRERYLIGPSYFDKYVFVLKIVLFAVFIGITISSFIGVIVSDGDIVAMISNYVMNLFLTLLQGAAWVTGVFALFEYYHVDLDKEAGFSINDLPQIPHQKAMISRVESVFAIMFSAIFFSVLYFAPQWMTIVIKSDSIYESFQVFNLEALHTYNFMIPLIFIVTIIQECLKMIWGKWTVNRAILSGVMSFISSGLLIVFFSNISIWNEKLTGLISQYANVEMSWIVNGIIAIIFFSTVLEIASSVYKGFKYGNEMSGNVTQNKSINVNKKV